MKKSDWLVIEETYEKVHGSACEQVHIFENSHFCFSKHIESTDCTLAAIKFRKKRPSAYKPLRI